LLTQTMGFWNTVQLTPAQEELLYDAFIEMSRDKDSDKSESEYFRDEKIAQVAVQILNSIARIGWTTSSHTAGYIPVFAIGAGADQFSGLQDNTEIPRRISKIAGYSF
ncbi:MAG: alkaline phosphatase, partial [Bacteroidales bacterium]